MNFKDHFSDHAQSYATARPTYPDSLFNHLASLCREHELAWDCATGNGQAAVGLSAYFKSVLATDASAEQIAQAQEASNIQYQQSPAENTAIADCSVDLVTVAQAIHWFEIEKFFAEVERVLKPEGVLAVWSYGLHEISVACDEITARLYSDIVGKYWPRERCHVEQRYEGVGFPYSAIAGPEFEILCEWSAQDVLNYYDSWSAVQRYWKDKGASPIALVADDFVQAWGEESVRVVRWPITLYARRKPVS